MFNSTNHIDFYKTQQPFNDTLLDSSPTETKPVSTTLSKTEDTLVIIGSVAGLTVFILFMVLAVWVFLERRPSKVRKHAVSRNLEASPEDLEANAARALREEGRRFREEQ